MQNEKLDAILVHHGVLGMKWGIRRSQAALDRAAGRKRSSPSEDYSKTQELKSKPRSELSNKELKALNERLQLEQNLNRLNPDVVKRGANIAKATLAIGTTLSTAYALYKSPLGQKITNAIKGTMNSVLVKRAYRKAMGG